MATTLISSGQIADLSPNTYGVHPFEALSTSLVNLAGTVIDNANLSDRANLSVSYTESGADAVAVVPEGDEITETSIGFKNIEVPSVKLGAVKSVSNELIKHSNTAADTAGRVVAQLTQDLRDAADRVVFGVNGPTTPGLTSLPLNEDITDLGNLGANLDWLSDALANIVDGGGIEQNAVIVASPRALAALMKLKDSSNGNRPLIDALAGTSQYQVPNATGMGDGTVPVRNIAGVPILTSRNMSDNATLGGGEIYVLDRPNLLVAATEVEVAVSHDAKFTSDSQVFRGVFRLGWKLARPERVSRATVPAPVSP